MARNLFISSFKFLSRLPLGAIGGILLFLVAQVVLTNLTCVWECLYYHSRPRADDFIRMEAQLHMASNESSEKYKVLLTGSSQTREDFDIEHLNTMFSENGTRFFNLGVSGNGSPIWMYMITNRLAATDPDLIVYMPMVGSFYGDYDFAQMLYDFDMRITPFFVQELDLNEIIDNREYFIRSFVNQYMPVLKYKSSIKYILSSSLSDALQQKDIIKPSYYAYVKNKESSYFKAEIKKAGGKRYSQSRHIELNKTLFTVFTQEITRKGICLVVISAPMHPLSHELYKNKLDSEFNGFIEQTAREQGFIYIASDQLPHFSEDDFIDFTHLNSAGRNKLTNYLSNYLLSDNWTFCHPKAK